MLRFFCFIIFFFFSLLEFSLSQWNDISPKGRKERIYSLDVKTKNTDIVLANYSRLTDTILAVGWSSTSGAAFLTFDGGRNWNVFQLPTLFPFTCQLLDNDLFVVCGYNFLYDNAEVKFFNFLGNLIFSYEFDGDSLPYCKNFFDCLADESNIYVCGYGGFVFRFDRSNFTWEQTIVDWNNVFLKIKKFDFTTVHGPLSLGFLLGGKSFTKQNSIYHSNPDFSEWHLLFNFEEKCIGVEIVDFWFYGWDAETNFPLGYVIGMCDDTVFIMSSDPKNRSFETIFKEQSTLQPLGIYVSKNSNEIISIFDDGKVLLSSNFGRSWTFVEERISKQLSGVKFFWYNTDELLPEVYWEKLNIFGFGIDGFIAKFEKELSLSIEPEKRENIGNCNELEIYDFLGRLVGRFSSIDDIKYYDKFFETGIYFLVKKANGKVCKIITYIFDKNILNFLRLF